MSFASYEYVLLLFILVACHRFLPWRYASCILLLGSWVFYASEHWQYIFLLLGVTLVAWSGGVAIARPETASHGSKKSILVLSLVLLLGLLGWFKYADFFSQQWLHLAALLRGEETPGFESLGVILPIGISFFTFQAISYLIDVYRGTTIPTRSFFRLAIYIGFFPQLIAGPIERANKMLPQFATRPSPSREDFYLGLERVVWGLFKKLVLADRFAIYVNAVYGDVSSASPYELWLATFCFAFQIYLDFSAYSDIAIGSARMFGINLSENFRWPYLSTSVQEFWRRWHITLGQWFRDYLYIPLGGNRNGLWKEMFNVAVVMFLTGLWHGAAWTFVLWGLFHGLFMVLHRFALALTGREESELFGSGMLARTGSVLFTFMVVTLSWVLFRAESLQDAITIYTSMFTLPGLPGVTAPNLERVFEFMLAGVILMHIVRGRGWLREQLRAVVEKTPEFYAVWIALLVVLTALLSVDSTQQFIYFAF